MMRLTQCMIDIITGLDYAHFTTNANESLNSELKRNTDYKESELPDFIQKLQEIVYEQKGTSLEAARKIW